MLHGTPAAAVYCSQGALMAPGDSREQSLVLDVAQHHLDPGQQTSAVPLVPSALSLFFPAPSPPSFHKSPAPLLHIWLSPASLSGRYFFHTSPNPMCKKSLTSLLPPTEQILISKFSKLFCLIILYFLSCLSWLPSYKSWFASFKIYCDVQIVSICICEISCEVSGENLL